MTISDWLKQAQAELAAAAITTARLDCLVLLSDELGKDKSWILAHPEHDLQIEKLNILSTKVAQRALHTPLAYVRGKTEFYGREFAVNEHVLEPRPESETIVELLKILPLPSEAAIADIGTGSGALAITAKLEVPTADVYAVDIDPNCLTVAKQNATALDADITLLEGNLLQPLSVLDSTFSVLLCNLPYVPNDFHINRAATHEPDLALFGGPDGLDLYRTLFEQTSELATKPNYIIAESLPTQHAELKEIAKAAGYSLEKTDDFIQLFSIS